MKTQSARVEPFIEFRLLVLSECYPLNIAIFAIPSTEILTSVSYLYVFAPHSHCLALSLSLALAISVSLYTFLFLWGLYTLRELEIQLDRL